MKRAHKFCPVAALTLALLSASFLQAQSTAPAHSTAADSVTFTVDPAQSSVHWTVDTTLHTVHGTFRIKSGTLTLDPSTGNATGQFVVDAASGASGNDSRDHRMHKEILESPNFSEIVFRPAHLDGKIPLQGSATAQLHGVFILHGADHEFTVPVETQLNGSQWKATSTFSVPYIAWKLKDPSNFILKVKPNVDVQVELSGTIAPR
jgi:polyisoprenoid-binding protein YceI